MATETVAHHADPFPVETAIDRVRALGDLLVSCGSQNVHVNTLPTVGGMLFDIADQLDEAMKSKGGTN